MAEQKFKVGDVVFLNSGSPKLTVTSVSINDENEEWLGVTYYSEGEFKEHNLQASCVHS